MRFAVSGRGASALLVVCLFASAFVALGGPASATDATATPSPDVLGHVTKFPLASISTSVAGVVPGPDGNLWFTERDANLVGYMTPEGQITEFPVPTAGSWPFAMTLGPDGNMWFTERVANKIAKVTPAGVITEYPVPTVADPLNDITLGPDGNLWFTEGAVKKIGSITPAGVITEYPLPDTANGITAGPDGNLWVTTLSSVIDRVTTTGTVTQFTAPTVGLWTANITAGPDGKLWFTDLNGSVSSLTTSGTFTRVPTLGNAMAGEITAGPDGNIWFTEPIANRIGRVTPAGALSEYVIPTPEGDVFPASITGAPDGNVWYGETGHLSRMGTVPTPVGEFTPLTPARIVDTRIGVGGKLGKLGPAQKFDVQIAGQGGVPATGVSAVVVNATSTEPTAPSYLTVWPAGLARPSPSNLNFVAGQTVPNLVTVAVANGKVSVYNNAGSTHVIFDVVGYYADAGGQFGSRFHALSPSRYFDTRVGSGGVAKRPVGPGETLRFTVTGKNGVPASGVTGVVMNVTVTEPTSSGFVTVFPDDVSRPVASNLNFVPGLTVPNLVVVRVPANGVVDFYNFSNGSGTLHLLADVVGYFDADRATEAGRLVAGQPTRLLDTRVASPAPPPGCVPGGGILSLRFTNPQLGAVVLNVTVTQPTASGYVTAYALDPQAPEPPLASTVNYVPGQTAPNLAMLKVGPFGHVGFYNYAGCTHLVVDAFAAFTSASALSPGADSAVSAADESTLYGEPSAALQ